MNIVLSTFILPHEIDDLEQILLQLKKSSLLLDSKIDFTIDVAMTIADDMIDWKKSSLPKSYFLDKLLKLSTDVDWCSKTFNASETIKGCISHKRDVLERYEDADYFIWLDSDIVFDERTLPYMISSLSALSEYDYTIITPEIVKLWDDTWDCLVNESFLDKPLNYHLTNNPYKDSGIKGEVSVESVVNTIPEQPSYKFAGGWFTCISAKLLNRIGIPESFGHYGPADDTYIMWASEKISRLDNNPVKQFKLKNIVVCENYRYRNQGHYINHMSIYNRKDEFKKIATSKLTEEYNKLT